MIEKNIEGLEKTIRADYTNMAGILVQQNGIKKYENYFHEFTADSAFHVFSVTKSIISALIGIAIDKGLVKSIDDRVLEYFPDYTPKRGEKTAQHVTLRNMLTMTTPYKIQIRALHEVFFE